MKIIGITGPAAAGKGTIVEYLVNKLGFLHYSVSGYLTKFLQEANKEINRDTMRELADSLRAQYGSNYIVGELYKLAEKNGKNAIIESIRTVGEVELLKNKPNFILLSVDADQKLRYDRAIARNSDKDHISFEKFQEQEKLEASNQDPNKGNILACQALADISLENNGDEESLFLKIDEMIKNDSL